MRALIGEPPSAHALGANPFCSAAALEASNYSALVDGEQVRLLDGRPLAPRARMADAMLRAFLLSDGFSCVAGKAALRTGAYRFAYYRSFPLNPCDALARDLAAFVLERPAIASPYASFIAVFDDPHVLNENDFEKTLWQQVQLLHELDYGHHAWDENASSDPGDKRFAFSFAQTSFFVVGMHPGASRRSRRFSLPALAFNAHAQFDAARTRGDFARIQRLVREREERLQGSVNPEMRDFGTVSEARQYSGRKTEDEWRCPFRPVSSS